MDHRKRVAVTKSRSLTPEIADKERWPGRRGPFSRVSEHWPAVTPQATADKSGCKRVEAAERALSILRCFEKPGEYLTLAAIAQRSGLHKSTILRLANSLKCIGFLRRDPRGLYCLGHELRRLGALAPEQPRGSLEEVIRPSLHHLMISSGETVSFFVLDGTERICVYRENSLQHARHHLEEGTRHPLKPGAAGEILDAFTNLADPAAKALREAGYAVSEGRRDPNLSAVAVPLLDSNGVLIGSLCISGLKTRLTPSALERARQMLIKEAAVLTSKIPFA